MAQDVNSLTIIGRLTKDLGNDERSFGYTQSGVCKASIDIATNRSKKQGDQWVDEVSYFTVLIWGKTAENLKPYLKKGTQICVKGFLKQERWTDQQGNNKNRVVIVSEQIQLLGGKKEQTQESQSSYAKQYQQ